MKRSMSSVSFTTSSLAMRRQASEVEREDGLQLGQQLRPPGRDVPQDLGDGLEFQAVAVEAGDEPQVGGLVHGAVLEQERRVVQWREVRPDFDLVLLGLEFYLAGQVEASHPVTPVAREIFRVDRLAVHLPDQPSGAK